MTNPLVLNFVQSRPKRAAEQLAKLPQREIQTFLGSLPPREASLVAAKLPSSILTQVLTFASPEILAGWIASANLADGSILIAHLPSNRYERLLEAAPSGQRVKLRKRLGLAGQTIGTLTTDEFVSVRPEQTCSEVLGLLSTADNLKDYPLIVIKDDASYIGIVPVHVLLTENNAGRQVSDFVQAVNPLSADASVDAALSLEEWYDYTALPVTDLQHRFVGIVSLRDLRRAGKQEKSPATLNASLPVVTSLFDLYANALDVLISGRRSL